jgi:hypothetical protein
MVLAIAVKVRLTELSEYDIYLICSLPTAMSNTTVIGQKRLRDEGVTTLQSGHDRIGNDDDGGGPSEVPVMKKEFYHPDIPGCWHYTVSL